MLRARRPAMKLALATMWLGSFALTSAQTASVDLQRVLLQTQEGRALSARLESKWRPKADALARRETNLKAERARFNLDSKRRRRFLFCRRYVMSRRQREATAAALATKEKDIDRERGDLRADFDAERIRLVNEMGRKMTAVAESYAKDHSLSLEYVDSTKRYRARGTDITPDIVRLYDQAYPVGR